MALKLIIKQPIWEYQKDHIGFLYESRKNLKSIKTRIGINISIILHSACSIEGYIENELKTLLEHRKSVLNKNDFEQFSLRRIYNCFIHNIEKDFETRISRTTGLEKFDSLIEIFSYKNKPDRLTDFKYFEGIKVLFQLRNVLAHGREVSAQRVSGIWTNGSWEDDFWGGYRQAESYLIKKKLINKKFVECQKIDHIFTNKVTDHFYSICKMFLKHCSNIFKIEKNETSVDNIIMQELSNKKMQPTQKTRG